MTPTQLQGYIAIGSTLISLGLATADKLRETWAAHGVDDAVLDQILDEVDRRLARRG